MSDVEQVRAYYHAVLPYYDASLEDRGDLPFWKAIARRWGAKRILELGCGTGRVTEVLARKASVTAGDLLIEMVHRARRKVPDANLFVSDLRKFWLASKFDLVVLADDPMAHIISADEREEVMQLIAEHLTADGRVVLEGLYRPLGKESLVPVRDIHRLGEKPFAVEESWKPTGQDPIWSATYRYIDGPLITEATSLLRSWTLEEVRLLSRAGLQVEDLWGDFDERPFCGTSARLLVVAKRPPE
jgi:SAM-dependent methyltransferase